MTALENIRAQLVTLIAEGSLAKSSCSQSLLKYIAPLIDAGVIAQQRTGAGRSIVVIDGEALQSFYLNRFPEEAAPVDQLSRLSGVAQFRDSKQLPNDTPDIISVRAWVEGAITSDAGEMEAMAATVRHGVFSFSLRAPGRYVLHGTVALVENPAVFASVERLQLSVGMAIFGRGRLSTSLLNWLAGMQDPTFSLLHLPDYDPVGLSEFIRLRRALGDRVHLHIPGDLGARFAKYSNRELLLRQHNQALLARVRQSDLPEVQEVVRLIDHHNAALEQEALFLG